jgi:Mg/Co/Ni transporter MgtE
MDEAGELARTYLEAHPDEAGRVLEGLDGADAAALCAELPPEQAAPALVAMVPSAAAEVVTRLPSEAAQALIPRLGSGAAVDILRCLPPEQRTALLDGLPRTRRARIALLLGQGPETLGAWADPRIPVVRGEATVGEARQALGAAPGDAGCALIVLDEDRRPVGVVPVARLLQADGPDPIGPLVARGVPVLSAGAGVAQARAARGWRAYGVVAVVDRRGRFLGGLTGSRLERALEPRPSPTIPASGAALTALTDTYLGVLGGLLHGLWAVFRPGPGRGGRHGQ